MAEKKVKEKLIKSSIFSNNKFRLGLLSVLILACGFLVQYFLNKPNFGTFIDSGMDSSSNVYILGVDEDNGQYKISKVGTSGSVKFTIKLEKSTDTLEYFYSNLAVDTNGNFYFVKQQRDLTAIVSDKSLLPIKNESVFMYDTNGKFVKQIFNKDFSKEANPPTKSYIRKVQMVGNNMTIIGSRDTIYDVITAQTLQDQSPRKIETFIIKPPYDVADASLDIVSDIASLSSGRVIYSTKNGSIFMMDNNGTFIDYSNIIPTSTIIAIGMSVDASDNVYFSDAVSGNFYKFNTKSILVEEIFKLSDKTSTGINISDLKTIKTILEGDYYAPSKAFDNPFYARFGNDNTQKTISNIRGSFFPLGFIIMVAIVIGLAAIFYLVYYFSKTVIRRVPLGTKLTLMFVPALLLGMGILVYMNTSDAVDSYVTLLRSDQERGARTLASYINGTNFSKLDQITGYMNPEYITLKKELKQGYNDLALKIGDESDYAITYIVKDGKIYSTMNSKYNPTSASYNVLKYTDPDLASLQYFLVDYVLEKDERDNIYAAWAKLSAPTTADTKAEVMYRDVSGDISATYVSIFDDSNRVVGFVGNYLDESVHRTNEFWSIFKHAISVILIITIALLAYFFFTVWRILRPLKKIEKALNSVGKGEWNTNIKLESNDELADVSKAFNLMSEKIDRYTQNLIKLNDEYIKYVPGELFKFIDKEKITQVNLHDSKVLPMNLLYMTLNISYRGSYNFKDEKELFEAISSSYESIFKIVEANNGVVYSFDGLDALFLFPKSAQDAFNASVQFKEIGIHPTIKENMNLTLGSGNVLVGITGDDKRRGVVIVSDEVAQMFNVDTQINLLGIKQVATKEIINNLNELSVKNYRYVGKIQKISGDGSLDIFELIDITNQYKKELYMSTKENFEKAVELYIFGDITAARKEFMEVLKINENDKAAIYYLLRCDREKLEAERLAKNKMKWKGYIL